VQRDVLKGLGLNSEEWLLGQGTIYPDTIETQGTANSALIKTHHNRVKIIQKMIEEGKVIEPLANLYKDEVREVGTKIGLPDRLIWRHPFPGPGLGVRCLCNNGEEDIDDKLKEGLNKITSPYKSTILPIRSVGVQGDYRTYRHPAVIFNCRDWDIVEKLSTNVTNKMKDINRVILAISHKEPQDFRMTKAFISNERLELLREADWIAMKTIEKHDLMRDIWQMPTVLVPMGISGGESIILRPVLSKEAMTAEFARIEFSVIEEIGKKIMKLEGIDAFFYDITNKPPATIEWE
jgi:GMP synthase (glutamine-hydrolysing)